MLQSRLEIELYQIVADCIQPALKHVFFVFLCFPLLINATLMLERPLAVAVRRKRPRSPATYQGWRGEHGLRHTYPGD